MDQDGAEGFFDTFLFLTILSVASCVAFTSAPSFLGYEEHERRNVAMEYADSSLDSILSSTLPDASYIESDGGRVKLQNGSTVKDFVLTETYLLLRGFPANSFDMCNARIELTIRELVAPAYSFSLEVYIDGGDDFRRVLSLGDARMSAGYSAASSYSVGGDLITIKLTLWWA